MFQNSSGPSSVLDDVRDFLKSLKSDLPEIFRKKEPPPPPASPRGVILDRVAYWSERMDARYRRVFIKNQRTLWGSCSARGNLNFNRRLVHAPLEVLDYVVIHELAHLTEMNHSKRFWAIVERWCPDYKQRRRWLRECGGALMRKA